MAKVFRHDDGNIVYYKTKDNKYHNKPGLPAVETKDYKLYYQYNELHREDGPAIEVFNTCIVHLPHSNEIMKLSQCAYFLMGQEISFENFWNLQKDEHGAKIFSEIFGTE